MFYVISWFFVVALLGMWSLAMWALHGVAVWTVSGAGALMSAASDAGAPALPDWLAPWVPTELVQATKALMAGFGPLVDSLLQAAPMLANGLTLVTWVVWAICSALLLLLGAGLHLGIALLRRRGDGGGGASGPKAGRSLAGG